MSRATRRHREVATLLSVFAALFVSACSSVRPFSSGRMGLIDRLSEADARSPRRERRPSLVDEAGRPVAKTQLSQQRLAEIRGAAEDWQWPTDQVSVTSHFGKRGGSFHEGIDLRAPTGTPIYAAQSGKVVYADRRIRGYGKMIVIQHPSGLSTVYAHNSRLFVKAGDEVKKGKRIALSGATGRATGPHLHFEVRDGVAAVNPYSVLPSVPADVDTSRKLARGKKARPGSQEVAYQDRR